jgi:hypothetical protein
MIRILLALPLLAAAAAATANEPPEFQASAERFADAAGCRLHLERLVADARAARLDAAEGPYEVAPSDLRAHTVRASGSGHRIDEYRCAAAELSARNWTRSMAAEEEEFTIESVARRAEWLKDRGGEQQ